MRSSRSFTTISTAPTAPTASALGLRLLATAGRARRAAVPAPVSALGTLLIATALATTGCSVADPDGAGADIVAQQNDAAGSGGAAGTTPGGDGDAGADKPGTRQRPVPAGTVVTIGDWQVSLGPTALDATAQVAAENQFNDPPAAGRQFVLVPVNVTYTGTDSGTPWVDLSINFYGSGGNTFGAGGTDDYCGVVPNSLSDVSEMFPNAKAAGNACVSVPSDQVQGGAWIIEESFSMENSRVFFALA